MNSDQISKLKVALAGSGGGGKTTLMEAWSARYNIPLVRVETKSMMPQGISTHLDIIRMSTSDPQEGVKFQARLIKTRSELFQSASNGFISDRAVVDSYAYYSMHNSMFASKEENDELYQYTKDSVTATDLTVFLAPNMVNYGGVPSNGIRLESIPYYHAVTAVIFKTLQDIVKADNIIDSTSMRVSDELVIHIVVTDNTAVCFFDESSAVKGMANTEERLRAIEMACEFILISRNK